MTAAISLGSMNESFPSPTGRNTAIFFRSSHIKKLEAKEPGRTIVHAIPLDRRRFTVAVPTRQRLGQHEIGIQVPPRQFDDMLNASCLCGVIGVGLHGGELVPKGKNQ